MTDDVEVEVEGQEVGEVASSAPPVEKAPKAAQVIPAEAGVEELKKQVESVRAEAAARIAERDRMLRQASERAHTAERQVVESRKGAVDGVIESLAKDREQAKRDIIAGHEAGDFAKVADAQDRLAAAHARIAAAEQGKLALQDQVDNPPPPVYVDNVEKLARQLIAAGSPRSAAWLRAHPEYAEVGPLNDKMIRAHNHAIGEELAPETDDYFAHIERRLGLRDQQIEQPVVQDKPNGAARAPVSAPVTRRAIRDNGAGAEAPGTVRLSAEERAIAIAMNTDPKRSEQEILRAYAKNKLALIAEGKMAGSA
jgi:hypothetical protein